MPSKIFIVTSGSDLAVVYKGRTVCTYDPQCDDAGCAEMLEQVAHSLSVIHGAEIKRTGVRELPDVWTWDDVIDMLGLSQEPTTTSTAVRLNHLDDEGQVADSSFIDLSGEQISDIIDHAAQLVILKRENASDDAVDSVYAELESALEVSGVI